MKRWALVAVVGLTLLGAVTYGVVQSASRLPGFWGAFEPSMWANVVGVSIAAVLGIPIGFAINHYFMGLAEQRNRGMKITKVLALLDLVRQEVAGHSGVIMELQSGIPRAGVGDQPTASVVVGSNARFRDVFGRQLIQDRDPAEIGETLISFELANYYFKVAGLNRLLDLRATSSQQSGAWDGLITNELGSLWGVLQQVEFEIQQAIDRLKRFGN